MELTNFPHQLTPFIGRQREQEELLALLADPRCRLLTLVGSGGIGKTRLAIQVARQITGFADGVCFVPLGAVRSADSLPSALMDALRLPPLHQDDSLDPIVRHLCDRTQLLVLDNFEHLLDGAFLLGELLAAAPGVKLLVTSREVLNLQEEWLYTLHGMALPDAEADLAESDLAEYDALRLFVERVRRVRPTFCWTDERAAVLRICRLTEGMPLAVELAAAWARSLDCSTIAAEIERSLNFLTSTQRNVPERHRSVRAVFSSSWDRLQARERAVLARLSVFRGGFQRDAAERVAGATLPILTTLVDKSLLSVDAQGRYQLHELLRQFAAEHLAQDPADAEQTRDRHTAHYTDFLHRLAAATRGQGQRQAMDAIAAEVENVRLAWHRAVAQADADALRKAVDALAFFFDMRGWYREGVSLLSAAIQQLHAQADRPDVPSVLAALYLHLGWAEIRLGRFEQAQADMEKSRAIYQQTGATPPPGLGTEPLVGLGVLANIRGDFAEAMRLGEEARGLSAARGDRDNWQNACAVLTSAAMAQGRYAEAQQYAQQAYRLAVEAGNLWFQGYILDDLGQIAHALGEPGEAAQHHRASYAIRDKFNDPEGMAVASLHLAEIALHQKDWKEAAECYHRSLTLYGEIDDRSGMASAHEGLGRVALAQGDVDAARRHLHSALRMAIQIEFVPLLLSILVSVADLLFQIDRSGLGQRILAAVIDHGSSSTSTRERAHRLLSIHRDSGAAGAPPPADGGQDLDAIVAHLLVELAVEIETSESDPSPRPLLHAADQPLVEPLTDRELEVLHLMADGLTNQEIADRLVIAVGTVKSHTSQIYGKLGVRGRTQAVVHARTIGLL